MIALIQKLADKQNWAKAAPVLAAISTALLFWRFTPSDAIFWALVNIPLYLFHQTEEHLWPGGFKEYMNRVIYKNPDGKETLTDIKIFWINILMVWVAFALFGVLAFFNIGFGLLIIIFSIMNCVTHIVEGIRRRRWNPGLVVASIQFILSLYGAWFITTRGLDAPVWWWTGSIVFSALVHLVLFRVVMKKE